MDNGRIVERGSHRDLLALNGLYTRLYEAQFQEQELQADATRTTLGLQGTFEPLR